MTRKWNIVNDNSKTNYGVGSEIIYNTEVLKSNICDYNDAYILVKGYITVTAAPATNVTFTNCTPFTKCITKTDGTTIVDAEDLDLVMPMCNLIEYSSYYSETTGSLWCYSKDKVTDFNADIANTNDFKSFRYRTKLLQNTYIFIIVIDGANGILRNTAIAVPLNYLSNFTRSLEMPLINFKVELKLRWTKYCVLSAVGNDNSNNIDNNNGNNVIFTIKDTKLYVSVVTLSAWDNQKLLKLLSKGFERSVCWNEYQTKSNNKNTTNELRYFLKSKFVKVNRLFVLVYTNHGNNAKRFNARKYYLPKGIIKNYNVVINGKNFYDQAIDKIINRTKWRLHYWMFVRLWLYEKSLYI